MKLDAKRYREYADAAEYWFNEGGNIRLALDAMRAAVAAAGFDDAILTDRDLLVLMRDYGGAITRLPADPFFLRISVRQLFDKCLEKKGA